MLHDVCGRGDLEQLMSALSGGASPDEARRQLVGTSGWSYGGQQQASDDGLYPLHTAARGGHAHLVGPLLAAGAELEARTAGGRTPLLTACLAGQLAVVEALLDAGADLGALGSDRRSAVYAAAAEGRPEIVKLLLGRGASVDEPSIGFSSAHLAASTALQTRKLAEGQAGVTTDGASYRFVRGHLRVDDNEMPWEDISYFGADPAVGHVLRHHLGAIECARLLAEAGSALTLVRGGTASHAFAELGEPALIAFVTDWSIRSANGATPLHSCATSRRPEGLEVALRLSGGDVSQTDHAGLTPLHHLVDQGGPARMFELLLAAGADPKTPVTRAGTYPLGYTAIDIARKWNDQDALRAMGVSA